MRLNRKLQYGLLMVFYLGRSGRATTSAVSQNLDLSKDFLEQVARQLRIGGVIKSVRGSSGGYELVGSPQVGRVFAALNDAPFLTVPEDEGYRRGETEHRSLVRLIDDFYFALYPVFDRKVKDVVSELVRAELHMVDRAVISARAN